MKLEHDSKQGSAVKTAEKPKESLIPSVKVEHKSTDKKTAETPSRFYTVGEDATILAIYKKHKSKKDYNLEKVAAEAHEKLPARSTDDIAERVNTFLGQLVKADEDKITKASVTLEE